MKKPNLFIVGAAKSGTTTLYKYLEQHSQVFMPEDDLFKEPAFFSDKGKSTGIDNYLNIFVKSNNKHKYIGEASTAYLTDPSSAKRIFDFNSDAKIIIILRNPVDRAYSLYNWMVQEGYEFSATFEKALSLEDKRKEKKIPNFFEPEYYWNYMYVESGLYYKQVQRYLDLFKDNVFLIIFEDMIKNEELTYKDLYSFLSIPYEKHLLNRENESKKVISSVGCFILKKISNQLNRFSKYNTKSQKDILLRICQLNTKPEKLSIEQRNQITKYFHKDVVKLSQLLNRDLSEVWKDFK